MNDRATAIKKGSMQSAPRSPIAGTPVINDSRKSTGDKANSFPPCLYKFIASDYIPVMRRIVRKRSVFTLAFNLGLFKGG